MFSLDYLLYNGGNSDEYNDYQLAIEPIGNDTIVVKTSKQEGQDFMQSDPLGTREALDAFLQGSLICAERLNMDKDQLIELLRNQTLEG